MTGTDFRQHLTAGAARAGLDLSPALIDGLETYYRLLARWNRRMNLTALALDPPTDDSIDRLFVEPLFAARFVPKDAINWFDLGSGCGSPAIPMKFLHSDTRLTMIESRGRKAAFLREAARSLQLRQTAVANARFEDLAADPMRRGEADFISIRAVRMDEALAGTVAALLSASGYALLFTAMDGHASPFPGFDVVSAEKSPVRPGHHRLVVLGRSVPRGTSGESD